MEKSHVEGDGECCLGRAVFPSMVREGLPPQNLKEGGSQQIPGAKMFRAQKRARYMPRGRRGLASPENSRKGSMGTGLGGEQMSDPGTFQATVKTSAFT